VEPDVTNTHNPRLDWARHLAGRGWPVFPILPGAKQPAITQWETRATTDPDRITAYWTAHPSHNIAIATGPAGLVVIDLDVAKPGKELPEDCKMAGAIHGAQMLARLSAQDGASVPATLTMRTPSGGTHLYFRQPATLPEQDGLRSTKGTLAGLIDTRACGGYVLAPGSATADGPYELVHDTEPAELPGWLAHRLSVRPSPAITAPRRIAAPHVNAYVAAAIEGETQRVRTAVSGRHNKAQMVAGLALGQLVGAGQLDHDTALHLLQHAAEGHVTGRCGCTEHGVTRTFEWALRAGARNPRQLTTDTEGTAA
jgi:hypothetical protein